MRLAALHLPLCHLLVHPHLCLKVAADELSIAERDLRSTHKPISTLFYAEFWLCRKFDAFACLGMFSSHGYGCLFVRCSVATSCHTHGTVCRSKQPCRVFHSPFLASQPTHL